MKWYTVLEGNAVKNPMVMGSADLKGWDEWWHYARGEKIDRWEETAWFKLNNGVTMGSLMMCFRSI